MKYETHHAGTSIVASVAPDLCTKLPVGFAVVVPSFVTRTNSNDEHADQYLAQDEFDEFIAEQIHRLQQKVYGFPDGMSKDILDENINHPNFAIDLARTLNSGNHPEVTNFVYYPRVKSSPSEKDSHRVVYGAGIFSTSGFSSNENPSEITLLHREGHPVFMVEREGAGERKYTNETARLSSLQNIVLKEFSRPLSEARRPCFFIDGGIFSDVLLNPIHAYSSKYRA